MSRSMNEPHNYFDAPVAAGYDAGSPEMYDPALLDPTVDLLAELAGDGSALELGIGTGRVALPLRARGVDVHGIELSPDMVEVLRAKPGGEEVPVTMGSFADVSTGGTYRLAYLVFNTIVNLTSQEEQVRCFQNAATHLEAGGCFLIEVFVPDLQRLPPGETFRVFHHGEEHLGIDEYDVVTQQMFSHHYSSEGDTYQRNSVPFRYVWPAELDLMARIAGLSLRDRWADWMCTPFTAESRAHVSVWQKPH